MTLKDAKHFINYNIKEGVYDESMPFEELTSEELIKFAEREESRGDYEAESQMEQESDEPF